MTRPCSWPVSPSCSCCSASRPRRSEARCSATRAAAAHLGGPRHRDGHVSCGLAVLNFQAFIEKSAFTRISNASALPRRPSPERPSDGGNRASADPCDVERRRGEPGLREGRLYRLLFVGIRGAVSRRGSRPRALSSVSASSASFPGDHDPLRGRHGWLPDSPFHQQADRGDERARDAHAGHRSRPARNGRLRRCQVFARPLTTSGRGPPWHKYSASPGVSTRRITRIERPSATKVSSRPTSSWARSESPGHLEGLESAQPK